MGLVKHILTVVMAEWGYALPAPLSFVSYCLILQHFFTFFLRFRMIPPFYENDSSGLSFYALHKPLCFWNMFLLLTLAPCSYLLISNTTMKNGWNISFSFFQINSAISKNTPLMWLIILRSVHSPYLHGDRLYLNRKAILSPGFPVHVWESRLVLI